MKHTKHLALFILMLLGLALMVVGTGCDDNTVTRVGDRLEEDWHSVPEDIGTSPLGQAVEGLRGACANGNCVGDGWAGDAIQFVEDTCLAKDLRGNCIQWDD